MEREGVERLFLRASQPASRGARVGHGVRGTYLGRGDVRDNLYVFA